MTVLPGTDSANLDPATAALLQLLAVSGTENFSDEQFDTHDMDWQAVLAAARRHGLELLLYDRLRAEAWKDRLPPEVKDSLRERYLAVTARNMVMLHHAAEILKALKAAGVEVIVLKGLYLVENIYASIGLRIFGDIDLLLRKESLVDALTVMQGLGYVLSTWYDPADPNTDIKHLPPLQKDKAPTIELHWTILEEDEPFSIDAEGLWQRAVPARVAGVEVLALALEDLILHLSLHHTYQHRLRAGLRSLYDIAEVLRLKGAELDWQRLLTTARQWGTERVTWLTLRLLQALSGATPPAAVMEDLMPDPPAERILADALEQVLNVEADAAITPDLAGLPAAQGFAKLRLMARRVFIPRRVLAREYNADPRSLRIYGYYLVRLRDLWRRYARPGWRLLTGEEGALAGAEGERVNDRLKEWMGGDSG